MSASLNPMQLYCPLCGSDHTEIEESLSYSTIRRLYKKFFNIRIQDSSLEYINCISCKTCGLVFFNPSIVGEEKLYEDLQKFPWYYLKDKTEFSFCSTFVSEEDFVLEIGCGEANFSAHLPRSCRYVGLEFNDAAINKAKSKGLNVYKSSVEDFIASEKEKADIVCAFQVLEHVADPKAFIANMVSAAKKDGYICLSVPSDESFLKYEMNNITNMPPHHQTKWPDSALQKVSELFGLELVALRREPPSEAHIPGFAKSEVFRIIHKYSGVKMPMLSRVGGYKITRALTTLLAYPFRHNANRPAAKNMGHTVVAIYRLK